jgi:dolichol-phosphate mannosyltransferase
MNKKKRLSIILPIYNEAKNLHLLYESLTKALDKKSKDFIYELIMINDGSLDDSWSIIQTLQQKNSHIMGINFSRNFGYQAALTAGYKHATGDAIITMDSDLQHPPELIDPMIKEWQKGYKIVYARRIDRQDTFLKKITARFYHYLLDSISEIKIPQGVSDFRLLDRQIVDEINQYHEKSRYLRGMIAWMGFDHTFVDFHQPSRQHDETKYTWSKLIKIAFDGIIGFSIIPLKLAAYAGFFVILTGTIMLGIITIDALFFQGQYPLFKWLVTILYIFIGVLFILLWILGEYIGRMYEELKGRPLFIIKEIKKIDPYINSWDR